jgi:hypothetical protein
MGLEAFCAAVTRNSFRCGFPRCQYGKQVREWRKCVGTFYSGTNVLTAGTNVSSMVRAGAAGGDASELAPGYIYYHTVYRGFAPALGAVRLANPAFPGPAGGAGMKFLDLAAPRAPSFDPGHSPGADVPRTRHHIQSNNKLSASGSARLRHPHVLGSMQAKFPRLALSALPAASVLCRVFGEALMINRVVALEHIRRMRGGAQSHLMRCSDDEYYVVKFQNNPQGTRILANEMLAGALATRLGLPTPEIAIVQVSNLLIEHTEELVIHLGRGRFACSPGLCFGSRYASAAHPPGTRAVLAAYDFLPLELMARVTNLVDFVGMLVFDKWTCNTDGRQVVFVRGIAPRTYNVVMIDNGFCFNAAEWNFPDAPLRGLYALPCAYEAVLGLESFAPWLRLLESNIDKQWLAQVAEEIPPEWCRRDANTLSSLVDKLESRRTSVAELLRSACAGSPQHFRNWTGKPGLIHFATGHPEPAPLRAKAARAASAYSQN